MDTFQHWLVNSSEDFQFLLYFGLLFVLMAIEHFYNFRKAIRNKRWLTNFVMTFIALMTMFSLPFTFITSANYASTNDFGLLNIIELNWIVVFTLTLLIRGFVSFFTHFLAHKIPLFWRVHRVHHLDTEMDVSTNVRFHPFEFLINIAIGIPIIILFGLPVWVLMFYELLDIIVTLFSHSNITIPKKIDRILRNFIVTPNLHRVHHSSYQPETDSNFSAVFPIWDIVFGTFRTKTIQNPSEMELGLKEVRDSRTNNVFWLLLSPFKNFKKNDKN